MRHIFGWVIAATTSLAIGWLPVHASTTQTAVANETGVAQFNAFIHDLTNGSFIYADLYVISLIPESPIYRPLPDLKVDRYKCEFKANTDFDELINILQKLERLPDDSEHADPAILIVLKRRIGANAEIYLSDKSVDGVAYGSLDGSHSVFKGDVSVQIRKFVEDHCRSRRL